MIDPERDEDMRSLAVREIIEAVPKVFASMATNSDGPRRSKPVAWHRNPGSRSAGSRPWAMPHTEKSASARGSATAGKAASSRPSRRSLGAWIRRYDPAQHRITMIDHRTTPARLHIVPSPRRRLRTAERQKARSSGVTMLPPNQIALYRLRPNLYGIREISLPPTCHNSRVKRLEQHRWKPK